jgi:hypothetical protein
MFIREKKNRSGIVSIQIISKCRGRYKVAKTIGCATEQHKIDQLKLQARSKAVDNLIAGLKIQTENMKNKERENRGKIAFVVPTQQKYVISVERQQKIKEELYLYLLNKKEENEPVGCHHFRNTAPQPGRTVEKRTV